MRGAAGVERAGAQGQVVIDKGAEVDGKSIESSGVGDGAGEYDLVWQVGFTDRLQIDGERGHGFAEEVFDHAEIAAGVLVVLRILRAAPLQARVVVAVYVEFPDEGDVAVVFYFDRLAKKFEQRRHDAATWLEQAFAQVDHVGDHRFVEEEVAHLFVQDDVDGIVGFEIAAVRGDKLNTFELVVLGEPAGMFQNVGVIDGVDFAGTLAGGERGENSGARAEVDHAVAGPDVARDRGVVEIHARLIGEHFFLFAELGKVPAVELAVVGIACV